jgi:hypothetical protein
MLAVVYYKLKFSSVALYDTQYEKQTSGRVHQLNQFS